MGFVSKRNQQKKRGVNRIEKKKREKIKGEAIKEDKLVQYDILFARKVRK